MDIKGIIDNVLKVADMVDDYIPGAAMVTNAVNLGKGVIGVIDALQADATPDQQAAMQAARAKLSASVKAKAASTSARLRG